MTVAEEIIFPISPLQEIMYSTDTIAFSYLTIGMSVDNYKQFLSIDCVVEFTGGSIGLNNEFRKRIKMS